MKPDAKIRCIRARAFVIPTDALESDGTIAWTSTTMVLVEVEAGTKTGIGYTYAHRVAADLVSGTLAPLLEGQDAMAVETCWRVMVDAVRNIGRRGIAATAISAVDAALWDLKARLLDLPLFRLLGAAHRTVPIYGSGGFTSYDDDRLARQLGGWADRKIGWVKMKVGRQPDRDLDRARVARNAVGDRARLMVDANGALSRRQAVDFAQAYHHLGAVWFEEPVSSDDLQGLAFVRAHAPGGLAVAAGEYGFDLWDFRAMLEAGAVDVLQADATRCLGITGFLRAGALAWAHHTPLSSHCAPALHLHPMCAVEGAMHMEWFHDHVRIEHMLFDGAPTPRDGVIGPDPARPGIGLDLKRADADRFAA